MTKYASHVQRTKKFLHDNKPPSEPPSPRDLALLRELRNFDWFGHDNKAYNFPEPTLISIMQLPSEQTADDHKSRMLLQLSKTCLACSMCDLGLEMAENGDDLRDPHIFSNVAISKFMVVGLNPGWDEVEQRVPFANSSFHSEIVKNGLSNDDLYITNVAKCYSKKLEAIHRKQCQPFLQMEMNVLQPKLVIALGRTVFGELCPDLSFESGFRKIAVSSVYGNLVTAISDPSENDFLDDITFICDLIKGFKKRVKTNR